MQDYLTHNNIIIKTGILTGLTIILYFFQIFPILGILGMLLCPIPFMYLIVKDDIKYGIYGVISVFIIISISAGIIYSTTYLFSYGIISLLLGYFIKNEKPAFITITYSTVILVICMFVGLAGISYFMKIDIINSLFSEYKTINKQMTKIMSSIFNQPELIKQYQTSLKESFKLLVLLLPALFISSISLIIMIYYYIINKIKDKFNIKVPFIKKFVFWRVPDRFIILFCILWALFIFMPGKNSYILNYTVINLIAIMVYLYLMQGISIIEFLFKKYNVHIIIKIIIYFLLTTNLPLLVIFGVMDIWFNYRTAVSFRNRQ